jgi:glycosyltransferase involved in cell wall biosynthesis
VAVFWGLIDRRLDLGWLRALTDPRSGMGGSLVLVGPTQAHDPAIAGLANVRLPGAVPYGELPRVAALADVLVMPYADTPATRAMQPLKLKEYLATGKPVVVRDLPATREWADAADVVDCAETFARTCAQRAQAGVPAGQRQARRRLLHESWDAKALTLEAIMLGPRRDGEAGRQREG